MRSLLINIIIILLSLIAKSTVAQLTISGTVYDSSKNYVVPDVRVFSTAGASAVTDSLGTYQLKAAQGDSIYFFYQGRNSVKYPVKDIQNYTAFDISLRVKVKDKYKLLQEVTVFSNNYKFDSAQNRIKYSKTFTDARPQLQTTYEPGGAAGIDLESLISIFQFRKNKQHLAFQRRLIEQEKDAYVDYKFNSQTISRITGLKGDDLESYKKIYRPSYEFVSNAPLITFYQYILNTSYAFKNRKGIE